MSRLIRVIIDCRSQAVRKIFEEVVSCRCDYLVTKGQGTGAVDLLLVELEELRIQQTFAHMQELLKVSPSAEVFLTSSLMDPYVLLEAFRGGVKEFLSQPLSRQDLELALARFEDRFKKRMSDGDVSSGQVVSVFGTRGGVGASTVATNLATSVQQASQRETVALVDFDLHGGDLGLFLDLHASRGLKQLSLDISRLDEVIVQSSMVKHASGLQLLASGYEGLDEAAPSIGSTMRVIRLLRSMYCYVFIDCGHVIEPVVMEALDASDQIIVVTTLSLPAIRRSKRLLDMLEVAQYQAGKVRLVVNRYHSDQKYLLAKTQELLGRQLAGLIPNDYETASEALDHGKPMVIMAPRTTIGQWYLRRSSQLISDKSAASGITCTQEMSETTSSFWRYLPNFGL